MPRTATKVALDFAVINAVGRSHWTETFQKPGGAEESYAIRKCRHQDTQGKCQEVGLEFQPMVMSTQSGMTPAMGSVLHKIADSVAAMEGMLQEEIRKDLFERLAVAVARCNARAQVRRRTTRPGVRARIWEQRHVG